MEVEIPRPVNPTGFSFIKVVSGALIHQHNVQPDKELTKALQYLGFKIQEKIGKDKLIKGVIEVDLGNKVVKAKKIEVWEKTRELEEPLSVNF